MRVGWWSPAEAVGTAGWLLRLKEQGRVSKLPAETLLLAGSEIWVLKHLGAFSSSHPSPETGAFGGATPEVRWRPGSQGLED